MRSIFRLSPLMLLLPAAVAVAATPADPGRIALRVEVFGPAGIHVVTSRTEIEEASGRYAIRSDIATRGLAGFFVNMKSHAEVRGRLAGGRLRPEAFRSETRRDGVDRRSEVVYGPNGEVSGSSTPPPESGVRAAAPGELRGTVDNLTAYFLLERHLAATGNCTVTIPVFDGLRRYDLQFTDGGRQTLSPSGGQRFSGQAHACHMKRREIAGFPADPAKTEGARAGTIWYGRLLPGERVQVVRMEMDTEAGQVSGYLAEIRGPGIEMQLMD